MQFELGKFYQHRKPVTHKPDTMRVYKCVMLNKNNKSVRCLSYPLHQGVNTSYVYIEASKFKRKDYKELE